MDLAIRFRSAVALVGRFPVLAGVDLDVARGEIVLLEGANGAGKTSILRAAAGLLRVVSGQAEVLGADLIEDPRAVRRRVGLLGHATALYDELSVVDNVRSTVRAAAGDLGRVEPALERLGLTGRLPKTPVGALSAGQRRRTAIAALVARDPELWLLDEPHAGLDAENRELLDALVRDAVARGAVTVLASHERDRARALAGRTVIVAGGATPAIVDGAPGVDTGGVDNPAAGSAPPTVARPAAVPPAADGPPILAVVAGVADAAPAPLGVNNPPSHATAHVA